MINQSYQKLGVPVWASDKAVIRAAHKRLRREARRMRRFRQPRHEWLRQILLVHHNALELYLAVSRGQL